MNFTEAVKWVDAIELHCLGRSDVSISEIVAASGIKAYQVTGRETVFITKRLRFMEFERYRVKDRTWRWRRPADRTGAAE